MSSTASASRPGRHDVLLALIDQAYAAADAPRLWERFLVSLAEAVNGRAARLLQHDLAASGQVNVWVPGTEYFSDFASHYDFSHLLTVVIGKHTGGDAVMSVLRGDGDSPFESGDRRLVTALVPHVKRALEIHQRIVDARHQRAVAVEALDALRCAVFLADADANVLLASRRGREMLAANDGLSSNRSRLTAADANTTTRLRGLCAAVAAARWSASPHPGGILALTRPSGRASLQALVAPAMSPDPLGLHDSRVAALMFVTDPTDELRPSETLLRELYGLTAAESCIAARIAIGWSLRRIAAERGSALETVRRQSKQILAKTGARHRSELILWLLATVPSSSRTPVGG